jgi:predicted SpoU family rRNA methylase
VSDIAELDKRITTHEAVCAERYGALLARMSRMEKIALSVAGTIIVGMGAALWQLATAVAKLNAGS